MAEHDDDSLQQGVEHLQAAAREMIQATRSLLDAAEGLVADPTALQGAIGTLGAMAQQAAARLRGDAAPHPDDGDDGPVESIPVR